MELLSTLNFFHVTQYLGIKPSMQSFSKYLETKSVSIFELKTWFAHIWHIKGTLCKSGSLFYTKGMYGGERKSRNLFSVIAQGERESWNLFYPVKIFFRDTLKGEKFCFMNLARDRAVKYEHYIMTFHIQKYLKGEHISSRNLVCWGCGASLN